MALSADERHVMLLNFSTVMVPKEAPAWSPAKFFEAVKLIHQAGQASMVVGEKVGEEEGEEANPKSIMRIADLREGTDGTITILLHHGDGKASDPRFMHKKTAKIRSAGMTVDETLSHAAHLVVQLPIGPAKALTVKAALERAPSLGRSNVMNFLNRLVRRSSTASDYRFMSDQGKSLRYHAKLAATMPLSANMKADLAESRINRIEFVRTMNMDEGLDEEGIIRPVSLRLVHEVAGKMNKLQNLNLYRRAKAKANANGFDEIQVRYTRPGMTSQQSPSFATAMDDAEDTLYTRHFTIQGFDAKLDQCPETIVDEVLSKMHEFFEKAKLWR